MDKKVETDAAKDAAKDVAKDAAPPPPPAESNAAAPPPEAKKATKAWSRMNFMNPGTDDDGGFAFLAPNLDRVAQGINPDLHNLYSMMKLTKPETVEKYLRVAKLAQLAKNNPVTAAEEIRDEFDKLKNGRIARLLGPGASTSTKKGGSGAYQSYRGAELAESVRTTFNDKVVMVCIAIATRYMCMSFLYVAIQSGFVRSIGMASFVYACMYASVIAIIVLLAATTGSQLLAEVLFGFNLNVSGRWFVNFVPVILQAVLGLVPGKIDDTPEVGQASGDSETNFDIRYALYRRVSVLTGISTVGGVLAILRYG